MIIVMWLMALTALLFAIVGTALVMLGGVFGLGFGAPFALSGYAVFAVLGGLAEILRMTKQIRNAVRASLKVAQNAELGLVC